MWTHDGLFGFVRACAVSVVLLISPLAWGAPGGGGPTGPCAGKPAGYQCHTRGAAIHCDRDTFCNGSSPNCPSFEQAANGEACNDSNACTDHDRCVNLVCNGNPIGNDCGPATCGASPSGCHQCGTCSAGATCMAGSCVANDPCAGVVCGQCQTCSQGACVADPGANGTGCVGLQSGTCVLALCDAGYCVVTVGDFDGTPPTIVCGELQQVQQSTHSRALAVLQAELRAAALMD